jgi:drug/metabolite transporter (DMT)-like permease
MTGAGLLPIFLGLASALVWGAADFSGGLASRRASAYRVVLTSEWFGLVLLLPLPVIFHEPMASIRDLLLAGLASLLGTFGIILLYRALAEGQMSVAAPVSALLSAVIPVLVGAWTQGIPGEITLAGFGLALVAIWLVSADATTQKTTRLRWAVLRLPLLSGLTFGAYFVLMHAATQAGAFWPLVSARLFGTVALLGYVWVTRQPGTPPPTAWRLAILCGALDVSGNVCYVLGGQAGRLDIAAVLGALYPGATVLLARVLLNERLSRWQAAGVWAALVAIGLIAI